MEILNIQGLYYFRFGKIFHQFLVTTISDDKIDWRFKYSNM